MNLIFDIILAAVMAMIIFFSFKKGLVSSLLSLASVVVASSFAWMFYKPLSEFISSKFLGLSLQEAVKNKISSYAENGDIESLFLDMPEGLESFLRNIGTDPVRVSDEFVSAGTSAVAYLDAFSERIGSVLTQTFSVGISLLVIFLVVYVLCTVASFFINSFFKLPILKQANQLLGLCLGVVCSLVFAWLFAHCSIKLFDGLRVLYPDNFNSDALRSSFLINLFYRFNPFTLF